VLVVDDEPDALALVCDVLQLAGARVTSASSAAGALEALARETVHAIVTDLAMPGMDGFGLIAALREGADPHLRRVPAAALTAFTQAEDRIRTLRSGFQMHLVKPIDPHALVAAVRALATGEGRTN
jgi:CheY-like chemotaxis protein